MEDASETSPCYHSLARENVTCFVRQTGKGCVQASVVLLKPLVVRNIHARMQSNVWVYYVGLWLFYLKTQIHGIFKYKPQTAKSNKMIEQEPLHRFIFDKWPAPFGELLVVVSVIPQLKIPNNSRPKRAMAL